MSWFRKKPKQEREGAVYGSLCSVNGLWMDPDLNVLLSTTCVFAVRAGKSLPGMVHSAETDSTGDPTLAARVAVESLYVFLLVLQYLVPERTRAQARTAAETDSDFKALLFPAVYSLYETADLTGLDKSTLQSYSRSILENRPSSLTTEEVDELQLGIESRIFGHVLSCLQIDSNSSAKQIVSDYLTESMMAIQAKANTILSAMRQT